MAQPDEKYQIKSPADAAALVMMEMTFLDHEQMRILILDTKNQVIENIQRYQGTVNSSVLRAAEVYRPREATGQDHIAAAIHGYAVARIVAPVPKAPRPLVGVASGIGPKPGHGAGVTEVRKVSLTGR